MLDEEDAGGAHGLHLHPGREPQLAHICMQPLCIYAVIPSVHCFVVIEIIVCVCTIHGQLELFLRMCFHQRDIYYWHFVFGMNWGAQLYTSW